MDKKFSLQILLLSLFFYSCGNSGSSNVPESPVNDSTVVVCDSDSVAKTEIVSDSLTVVKKDTSWIKRTPVVKGPLLVPTVKVKGIYVTGPTAGSKRMKEMVDLITSTDMNAMVLDVKNDGGNITYKINYQLAEETGACMRYVRDMPALIKELHEKGIYVIGRIVCFKDPYLAKHKPELALCKPDGSPVADGKGLPWVNPYKKEVWDYLCSLAEQATLDGFDEIQFDYVRFPIGKDANQADYGVDLSTYSREQCLTDFFAYVQKRLHVKHIVYGADLFGTIIGSEIDRDRTGQDYVEIATMMDAVCPMIYPSHYGHGTFGLNVPDAEPYQTIYKALLLSKEQLKRTDSIPTAVIRPWLQCFSAPWVKGHITYGSKQIRQQIQAVYDAGYDEWILWNAANKYGQVKNALTKGEESKEDEKDKAVEDKSKEESPKANDTTKTVRDTVVQGD